MQTAVPFQRLGHLSSPDRQANNYFFSVPEQNLSPLNVYALVWW